MLSTDAYVFLNINDPLCAWNTVRSVLVSAGYGAEGDGFVSVWTASLMKDDKSRRFSMGLLLENVRRQVAPQKIPRLRGVNRLPNLTLDRRPILTPLSDGLGR